MPELIQHTDSWNFDMEDFIDIKNIVYRRFHMEKRTQTISSTYCLCSRGFVQKYWEGIVGKPLTVELLESCLCGARECKFAIHL
jgi:predicted hydrocarbon binding protein